MRVSEPGDAAEREADDVAEQVMRMAEPGSIPGVAIQRKCIECDEDQQGTIQARRGSSRQSGVALDTAAAIRAARRVGIPLSREVRSYFEPRFGRDLSAVRVHADGQAAEGARAIQARAYTIGHDIVFGAGEYSLATNQGRHLLTHELAHVVQQEAARPTLFRRVGSMNCPPNVFGAPADPKAAIEPVDPIAVNLATQAADGLAVDAEAVKTGLPAAPSVTFQSYQDHFGLPVAVGRGYLNRLTGVVRPSLEVAASEELRILSRRFRFSARLFSQTVSYRCPGADVVTLPGCGAGSCGTAFAFSCSGGTTIALCQPFWDRLVSDETKAAALIHESMHIIFGVTGRGLPGEIGETTQQGSGRNFNIAGCYEFIIDDIAGVDSFPVCPPIP